MNKTACLAGSAILALAIIAGPAFAQTSITRTEKLTDSYGTQSEVSKTFKQDSEGTSSTAETSIKRPDGSSETTVQEKSTSNPVTIVPAPRSESSTTTTTTIGR